MRDMARKGVWEARRTASGEGAGSPTRKSVHNALNHAIMRNEHTPSQIRHVSVQSVLPSRPTAGVHLLRVACHDLGSLRPRVGGGDVVRVFGRRGRQVPAAVVRRMQCHRFGQNLQNCGGQAPLHSRTIANQIQKNTGNARLGGRRTRGIGMDASDKRRGRNGTKERVGTKTSVAKHQQQHACGHCQNTFWSSRPWAKFCSSSCRMRAAYERKWLAARKDAP